MTAEIPAATKSLAATLRHGSTAPLGAAMTVEMVEQAVEHGIAPLLYRAFVDSGAWHGIPAAARQALARDARAAVLLDAIRTDDLRRTLPALSEAGVRPLLFKGAALSATHYPASWLRPRGDTDLLVRHEQVTAAAGVFHRLGFERLPRPAGAWVTNQARFIGANGGVEVAYDLHWRVSDPQPFAGVFSYDELASDAQGDPLVPSDVHALLIACVHRVAHHFDSDTLILIYDIDRIARGLDEAGWDAFADLAAQKRVRAVARRGLQLAAELFGTEVPAAVTERLGAVAGQEATSAYLADRLRRVDLLRLDLASLAGWRDRTRLLREHLFPPASYIRALYRDDRPLTLPAWYVFRIARGATSWLRRL